MSLNRIKGLLHRSRTTPEAREATSRSSVGNSVPAQNGSQSIWEELPKRHIRVLRLEADRKIKQGTGRIPTVRCSLATVPFALVLSGAVVYTALSYVWNQSDAPGFQTIVCNGQETVVTTNLFNALHQISQPNKRQALWVDALCINQANVREKNHQVALMAEIYRHASFVIAWMGNNDNAAWFESPLRSPWYRISNKEHFTRAWTFQEMTSARQLLIQQGSWSHLYDANNTVAFPQFLPIRQAREMIEAGKSPELLMLLLSIWEREASEPRDKIFAVYGLLRGDLPTEIDYDMPIFELVTRVAKYMLKSHLGPQLLNIAVDKDGVREDGLPSWAVAWHKIGPPLKSTQLPLAGQPFLRSQLSWTSDDLPRLAGVAFGRLDNNLVIREQKYKSERPKYRNEPAIKPFPKCISDARSIRDTRSAAENTYTAVTKSNIGEMCETLAKHDERACTCKWLKVAGPAADSDPDFDVDHEETFDEAFDANFDADFKPGLKTDLRAARYTETDKDLEDRALLRSDRGYGTVFHGQTPVYPGSRTGDWLVQLFGMRNKCVLRPIRHEAHFDAQGTFHNSYYTFFLDIGVR